MGRGREALPGPPRPGKRMSEKTSEFAHPRGLLTSFRPNKVVLSVLPVGNGSPSPLYGLARTHQVVHSNPVSVEHGFRSVAEKAKSHDRLSCRLTPGLESQE